MKLRQRGTLFLYRGKAGEEWRGRFREPRYRTRQKRKERSVRLGMMSEMTEEARAKLDAIVSSVNDDAGRTLTVSTPSPVAMSLPKIPAGNAVSGGRGITGLLSEMFVCADLLAKGHEVYRALNPQAPCDLICIMDARYVRVEVKTRPETSTIVSLKGKEGKFDLLAIVDRDSGSVEYRSYSELIYDRGELSCYLQV